MKKKPITIEILKCKKLYESPAVSAIMLDLEQGIAAGSVQTGMQQEHEEENQSFDAEW
ncbi:hypothetical protein D3C87_1863520 [compost metagenome]